MKYKIKSVGVGRFGPMYEGIKGCDAVKFLMSVKEGEVKCAFWHPEVGTIDLVWDCGEGKGLLSISIDHHDTIHFLDKMIEDSEVYSKTLNRIKLISHVGDRQGTVVIRLDFDGEAKNWILTAFIHEKEI